MDDVAHIAAEDAVVLVLAFVGVAEFATLAQTVEVAPVVPASRFLAEIAGDGALVAQLRAGNDLGGIGKGAVAFANIGGLGDLGDGGHGAEPETAVRGGLDPAEFGDGGQGDDGVGGEDPVAETADEIGAAAVDSCVSVIEDGTAPHEWNRDEDS